MLTKRQFPLHIILGASVYAKMKTDINAKIGKPGEPVREHARLGWIVISSGELDDVYQMFS